MESRWARRAKSAWARATTSGASARAKRRTISAPELRSRPPAVVRLPLPAPRDVAEVPQATAHRVAPLQSLQPLCARLLVGAAVREMGGEDLSRVRWAVAHDRHAQVVPQSAGQSWGIRQHDDEMRPRVSQECLQAGQVPCTKRERVRRLHHQISVHTLSPRPPPREVDSPVHLDEHGFLLAVGQQVEACVSRPVPGSPMSTAILESSATSASSKHGGRTKRRLAVFRYLARTGPCRIGPVVVPPSVAVDTTCRWSPVTRPVLTVPCGATTTISRPARAATSVSRSPTCGTSAATVGSTVRVAGNLDGGHVLAPWTVPVLMIPRSAFKTVAGGAAPHSGFRHCAMDGSCLGDPLRPTEHTDVVRTAIFFCSHVVLPCF